MANQYDTSRDVRVRFMSHVTRQDDGCWLWIGATNGNGYGTFNLNGKTILAHIAAYLMLKGEIPDGLTLDHQCHKTETCPGGPECRHRRCVNPEHLEAITQAQNSMRGHHRHESGVLAAADAHRRITHCPSGHEYTSENTGLSSGSRFCRECKRIRTRNHKAKLRAQLQSFLGGSAK